MSNHSVRIDLKVIPSASRDEVVGWLDKSLKVKVAAPPERGQANKAVIKILAQQLGLPAAQIQIESGSSSQRKSVLINGLNLAEVEARLMRDKTL
ncbi:MAG: DUF167 domain-containing protein [Moraxellaceae bacterium]|nr:DUF167 domain-containing protein [Moraxellaceae bacterium]MDP1776492.1 DUF167 domain-containing protein [Moraxellaceae bacterium]MDZ4299162.1 DUF167 domain-containing protein [Moraxellaceae bacterium]MDZ4386284.1 DUF167 domain-containing protein [Moraxellaceae bacterium]